MNIALRTEPSCQVAWIVLPRQFVHHKTVCWLMFVFSHPCGSKRYKDAGLDL